jgi:hypothetical protein
VGLKWKVQVEGGVQPMDRGLYIFLLVYATYSPEGEFGGDGADISLSGKEGNLPLYLPRMNGL